MAASEEVPAGVPSVRQSWVGKSPTGKNARLPTTVDGPSTPGASRVTPLPSLAHSPDSPPSAVADQTRLPPRACSSRGNDEGLSAPSTVTVPVPAAVPSVAHSWGPRVGSEVALK